MVGKGSRSAILFQTEDQVVFALYARGFLQRGLTQWENDEGWGLQGHVNLIEDKQTVRRFEIRITSREPETLYFDGKAFALKAPTPPRAGEQQAAGRLLILREQGEPLQTRPNLKRTEKTLLDPKKPGSLAFFAEQDLTESSSEKQEGSAEPKNEEAGESALLPVFEKKVSLTAKEMPLKEAFGELARQAGIGLELDEPALAKANVDLDRKVTVQFNDLPFDVALGEVMDWHF